jgi:hypothetical protein
MREFEGHLGECLGFQKKIQRSLSIYRQTDIQHRPCHRFLPVFLVLYHTNTILFISEHIPVAQFEIVF